MGTNIVDITDKIPFDVPENWIWCRGSQCFTSMQNRKPCGDNFYYIDIDAIDNRLQRIKEPKKISTAKAPSRASRAVQTGSVLFSLVRPYLKNIAYISDEYSDCIASTGFYVCNSSGILDPKYMYYLMISNYVVEGLNQFMKGDNSPSINASDIEGWLYPIPPKKEQARIVQCIENLLTTVESMQRYLS